MSKNKSTIISDDNELIEELEENVLPPDNIVVLNEQRSAADLYRLMSDDDSIDLQPDFQRDDDVWGEADKARFIDSLAKEFPIPSMCFAYDHRKRKYIVIDGLQRMSTIKKFLGKNDWTLAKLSDIDKKISGKHVEAIKKDNPEIFRGIENISLPVTVLRYDPTRSDNMDYIFTIFQRINTFGARLNNQEIRNAIYQGPLNSFIKKCAKNKKWITLTKIPKKGRSTRMISEERALRFFAFYENLGEYKGHLNKFLNDYMCEKRDESDNFQRETIFNSIIEIVEKIGVGKIGKTNARLDAVLYGVAKNITSLKSKNSSELGQLLKKLESNPHFSVEELSGGVMQKSKVENRLKAAMTIFSDR